MDNEKLLVEVIAAIAEGNSAVSKIQKADIDSGATAALDGWVADKDIPIDDEDTTMDFYMFKGEGLPNTYLADYAGEDPDQFRMMAVLQGNTVIGESIDVGD